MNEVIDFQTRKGNTQNNEVETAWHIFAALSQYHASNPVVSDLPDFGKAVLNAHENWARLFSK